MVMARVVGRASSPCVHARPREHGAAVHAHCERVAAVMLLGEWARDCSTVGARPQLRLCAPAVQFMVLQRPTFLEQASQKKLSSRKLQVLVSLGVCPNPRGAPDPPSRV